ncbi:MAG: SpoIIE family protein phosphatase [Planctomycetes bacterium]|nr:SpoIIE family protein phosphatase [Planctomycetota bacterium]
MTREGHPQPTKKAKLLVKRGQNVGTVYEIDTSKSWTIGRDSTCELQFYDKGLSRNHSMIAAEDGGFVISDLGSTNGTYVNGKMIIRKPLGEGDLVRMGKIELQFMADEASTASSSYIQMIDDKDQGPGHTIVRRVDIDSVTLERDFREKGELQTHVRHLQKTLKMLYQLGKDLNRASDRMTLLSQVLDFVMGLLRAERAFIILFDSERDSVEPYLSRSRKGGEQEFKISKTVVNQVVHEKKSVLSSNAMMDDRFKGGMSIILHHIQSVMCVPLESQDRVFGAIYVDSQGTSDIFSQDDLDLLSMLGQQAGTALERIELTAQMVEKQKLEQALLVAQGIQQNFLPRAVPKSVQIDVVGWNKACDETGGDYYDFIELPGNRLGLAIADVSGHGVGAALLMATARAFLRALSLSEENLIPIMNRMNALLDKDLEDDQFVTFFYGVLDLQKYSLRYCSAGHDTPLVYRVADGTFEQLESTGIPLGMLDTYVYHDEREVQFNIGDILILSTDGIVEAMNAKNKEFGRDRLMEAIAGAADMSSNQIVMAVYERMREFVQDSPQRDDLTLVVVKFSQRVGLGVDETVEAARGGTSAHRLLDLATTPPEDARALDDTSDGEDGLDVTRCD